MMSWTAQVFQSQIAKRGGVVRRKLTSIDWYSSVDDVKRECQRRGYHIVEHAGQWLIFCDKAAVKIIL